MILLAQLLQTQPRSFVDKSEDIPPVYFYYLFLVWRRVARTSDNRSELGPLC